MADIVTSVSRDLDSLRDVPVSRDELAAEEARAVDSRGVVDRSRVELQRIHTDAWCLG